MPLGGVRPWPNVGPDDRRYHRGICLIWNGSPSPVVSRPFCCSSRHRGRACHRGDRRQRFVRAIWAPNRGLLEEARRGAEDEHGRAGHRNAPRGRGSAGERGEDLGAICHQARSRDSGDMGSLFGAIEVVGLPHAVNIAVIRGHRTQERILRHASLWVAAVAIAHTAPQDHSEPYERSGCTTFWS